MSHSLQPQLAWPLPPQPALAASEGPLLPWHAQPGQLCSLARLLPEARAAPRQLPPLPQVLGLDLLQLCSSGCARATGSLVHPPYSPPPSALPHRAPGGQAGQPPMQMAFLEALFPSLNPGEGAQGCLHKGQQHLL